MIERCLLDDVPFLGICLGLQCAIIEFARNACGLEGADSAEFTPDTPHPVISLLDSQRKVTDMGGTMRLGAYPCVLQEGSRVLSVYGEPEISERHRHRFEVNNDYREQLEAAGLVLCGVSPDGTLVEMVELPDHAHFVGCQFHPEFKSRPMDPHPLFRKFIGASLEHKRGREEVAPMASSGQ